MKTQSFSKKAAPVIALLFLFGEIIAQNVPQGFNYQAIVRDNAGVQLINQNVPVRAAIISGSSTGDVEWLEEHTASTNQFGLVSIVIGQGKYLGGRQTDFEKIPWGEFSHYLKIQVDLGSGFTVMGTAQLFAVPYALYAKTVSGQDSTWIVDGNNIYTPVKGNVGIGNKDPRAKLNVTDGSILFDGYIGSTPVAGEGTRLMWIPNKAAFRAGIVSINDLSTADDESSFWNETNIGYNSAAFGKQTRALGNYSFATGFNTKAQSSHSFVTGRFNIDAGNPEAWIDTDPLFIIGNGTDVLNPANAVTVLKNARVGIVTPNPTQTLDVDGTIRMRAGSPPFTKAWLLVSDTSGEGNFRWQDPRTFNDGKWLITDTVIGTMVSQNPGLIGIRNNFPEEILHIGSATDTSNTDYFIKIQTPTANNSGIIFAGDSTLIWQIRRDGSSNNLDILYNGAKHVSFEPGGDVGIGITNPATRFHVQADKAGNSNNPNNYVAIIENTNGSSGGSSSSNGLAVKLGLDFPDADNNYVSFFDSDNDVMGRIEGQNATDVLTDPEYILNTAIFAIELTSAIAEQVAAATSVTTCAGLGAVVCVPIPSLNVYAAINIGLTIASEAVYQAFVFANLGVSYSSGSGDYAEWLERQNPNEEISYGDIVGVRGGKISKNTEGAENLMAVSLSPIILGNMPEKSKEHLYEKVAFLGQIPVKVIGEVKIGDYILPSGNNDGFGKAVSPENMKMQDYAQIVGRAWTASRNGLFNYINVAVGINNNDLVEVAKRQQDELEQLKEQVNSIQKTLAQLVPQNESANDKAQQPTATAAAQTTPVVNTRAEFTYDPELLMQSFKMIEKMYEGLGIDVSQSPDLQKLLTDGNYQQEKVKEIIEKYKVRENVSEIGKAWEKGVNKKK